MEITKLTSKIRNISRISVIGIIAYIVYYIYTYFPDAKAGFIDGWNETEEAFPDKSDLQAVLYVLAAFVLLTALIIISNFCLDGEICRFCRKIGTIKRAKDRQSNIR